MGLLKWNIPEQSPNAQSERPGILSYPQGQTGPLSQLAYQMGSSPNPIPGAGKSLFPFASSGVLGPSSGGGGSSIFGSGDPNAKMTGAASGALAGLKAGPWGALVGGIAGYAASGGAKDLNPIDASGFSGISMDQARSQGNLARLGSNPGAAVASYAGIKSNSDIGRALDPTAFLGGLFRSSHGDEKRNLKAFNEAFPGITSAGDKVTLPDGRVITPGQLQNLAGTWYGATYHPDGNQSDWQDRFNSALTDLYSQPPGG